MSGLKDIEYRTWSTAYRGPLAIHAASTRPSEAVLCEIESDFGPIDRAALVYRAMIGIVQLVEVRPTLERDFEFVLANARECEPVPMPGQLNLWEVEADFF